MKFSELPPEQQKFFQDFDNIFRPLMGAFNRNNKQFSALKDFYQTGLDALVAGLDDGEIIGTETGLAGTQPLTKESITKYMQVIAILLANYATDSARQELIEIGGISAAL